MSHKMTLDDKMLLRTKCSNFGRKDYVFLLNLIKSDTSNITQNSNGFFVDLNILSDEILWKMDQYVNCIFNIQRKVAMAPDKSRAKSLTLSSQKKKKITQIIQKSPIVNPKKMPKKESISLSPGGVSASGGSQYNICQSFGLNQSDVQTSHGIIESLNDEVILSNYEKSILKKNKYIQEQVEFKQQKSRDSEEY